jgi:hypothetical protein
MKRGIYLVANLKSQDICKNLIYSIRASGCSLPILLIHFGGKEINCSYILSQVEFIHYENFSEEAKGFINNLETVLECPRGFLFRYLAWFSDWEEFIYSDNDIVALCNWNELFDHLEGYDLVHADKEYTTNGYYNYSKPESIKAIFGQNALESAMTAGHIVVRKRDKMIDDINAAVEWFKNNPAVPYRHDQSLMHIASLIGNWRVLNLCRSFNWLSSWAGDYKNTLEIIQQIQNSNSKISHIHYSGSNPRGSLAIQDLLFATNDDKKRLARLSVVGLKSFSGYEYMRYQYLRLKRFCKRKFVISSSNSKRILSR